MYYFARGDQDRRWDRRWAPDDLLTRQLPLVADRPIGRRSPALLRDRRGLTKNEAEDLLDWLEAAGCRRYELAGVDGSGFTVRWWD
jgi:hypothetical protein